LAACRAARGASADHNPFTFTTWLAGGGRQGGVTYGASDEWSFRAAEHPTFCYDVHATVLHLLGIDHTRLTYRHNGIDRRLTDVHGHVIDEIIALRPSGSSARDPLVFAQTTISCGASVRKSSDHERGCLRPMCHVVTLRECNGIGPCKFASGALHFLTWQVSSPHAECRFPIAKKLSPARRIDERPLRALRG